MNRTVIAMAIAALFAVVGFARASDGTEIAPKNHHAKSVMELDPTSVFPTQGPDDN